MSSFIATFSRLKRRSRRELFCKKGVLKNFAKCTGKHICHKLCFLMKLHARPVTLFKKCKKVTLTQVFSFEFCKYFKNTFFYRTPLEAASVPKQTRKLKLYINLKTLNNTYYKSLWMPSKSYE